MDQYDKHYDNNHYDEDDNYHYDEDNDDGTGVKGGNGCVQEGQCDQCYSVPLVHQVVV